MFQINLFDKLPITYGKVAVMLAVLFPFNYSSLFIFESHLPINDLFFAICVSLAFSITWLFLNYWFMSLAISPAVSYHKKELAKNAKIETNPKENGSKEEEPYKNVSFESPAPVILLAFGMLLSYGVGTNLKGMLIRQYLVLCIFHLIIGFIIWSVLRIYLIPRDKKTERIAKAKELFNNP